MATTSTVHDVLCYLQAQLSARAGLSGVQVLSGPVSTEQVATESIQFWHVQDTLEWRTLGNLRRQEDYDILGAIYVERPGAGESAIQETRGRAYALLAELETFIVEDHRLGELVRAATLKDTGLIQEASATGRRACTIPLTLNVKTTLTRT